MTTVSSTSSTSSTSSSSSSSSTSGQKIQDSFMNLLVAQLQNQDPLNPMDNSQMTAQLAQINTVQGIETLNSTLQTLMGSYSTSQQMQAASLVGHGVLSSGNALQLASGGTAAGGFSLASAADTATVTITNAAGQVVHTASLSDLSSGINTFTWDGSTTSGATAPAGNYSFSITATANGKAVTSTPLKYSVVDGVSGGANSSSGSVLNTSTGTISWSDIQQVI